MSTIQRLIGERFEEFILEKYPELEKTKYEGILPDFEHELFFAEAKVAFYGHDFGTHLKQYQIESFKRLNKEKPVIYIMGFHNFSNSMQKLGSMNLEKRKKVLKKEMNISHIFIVDELTIRKIWEKRNCWSAKEHILDCIVRDGHLRQIIENSEITAKGEKHYAQQYYGIQTEKYSFSEPISNETKGLQVGYIMPKKLTDIVSYFYE